MALQGHHSDKCFDALYREIKCISSRERLGDDRSIVLFSTYFIVFISAHFYSLKLSAWLLMEPCHVNIWVKAVRKTPHCTERVLSFFLFFSWKQLLFQPNVHWTAEMLQNVIQSVETALRVKKKNIIDWILVQTQSGFTVRKISISTPTSVNQESCWQWEGRWMASSGRRMQHASGNCIDEGEGD